MANIKADTYPRKPCIDFFGDVDLSQVRSGEDLLEIYKNNIEGYRDLVEDILIRGGSRFGDFHYNLIFATKKTEGGSPWFKSIEDLKSRIEKHSGGAVEKAFDILSGRIRELGWFVNDDQDFQRSLFDFE